eukprot:TRINITY_DN694_c0_g1_i1.p1 TRINITY_DN694_c0_g1~~TRINITY_DN694_c0_g1_i1.p1  ORF type:complete len:156 (-),score=11.53 TRINITY_DN694_c0_g1_i1:277-708(-)
MGNIWRANVAFVVLLLLTMSHSTEAVKVDSTQLVALNAFKAAIRPASLFSSWVTTNDCAKWNGISCDSTGFVKSLNFSGVIENGTIPAEITQLTQLTSLLISAAGVSCIAAGTSARHPAFGQHLRRGCCRSAALASARPHVVP